MYLEQVRVQLNVSQPLKGSQITDREEVAQRSNLLFVGNQMTPTVQDHAGMWQACGVFILCVSLFITEFSKMFQCHGKDSDYIWTITEAAISSIVLDVGFRSEETQLQY